MSADLAAIRRHYADMVASRPDPADRRIRDAFATVPREAFLGPPPWTVRGASWPLTASEPAALYHDVLVALDAGKGINNGSPSLHAQMLHRLDVQPGHRVLHVGAGGGYYTAILAELAGPAGQVKAIEYDAALAGAARQNLAPWPWVAVVNGDGAAWPTGETDRIYVNFALADPAEAWLDHLAMEGRLLFPLGSPHPDATDAERRHSARAVIAVVTRTAAGFAATLDGPVAFVFAEGPTAGDAATQRAVYEALGRGDLACVRSLHREPPPTGAWLATPRWSLGLDPP